MAEKMELMDHLNIEHRLTIYDFRSEILRISNINVPRSNIIKGFIK